MYGVLGVLLIPLNYFVIDLFQGRAMHPENLSSGSLGEGMGRPFLMANLALFAAFAYCVLLRFEVGMARSRVAQRFEERVAREAVS